MFRLKNLYLDEENAGAAGGAPEPAPTGDVSKAEASGQDWRSGLPEGVREWQEVETAKTPDDFYKQMEHYRSAYGRSIRVPGEDAGQEDRQKFLERLRQAAPELVPAPDVDDQEVMDSLYSTLGRPSSPDDYRLPESAESMDQDRVARFKEVAHKSGLTQKQVESVLGDYIGSEMEMQQGQMERLQEGTQRLKTDWGLVYDRNMKAASTVAERFGFTEDVVNAIASGQMGEENTRAFYAMAKATGGEGVNIANEPGGVAQMMTPDEARLQIQEIHKDKTHAYWNPSNPAHKAARKKMRKLHVMAQGNDNREVSLQAQTAGIGGGLNYGE